MAKWMTLKSKRKACVGKGKQAKCRVITVKRKVRINPDEREIEHQKSDSRKMIEMMHESIFEKGSTILNDIHPKSLTQFHEHLSKAFEYLYR